MSPDLLKESIVFLGGVVLSSLLLPLSLPLFKKLGVVDHPNARSSHTTAIPRGMGIVVVVSFLGVLLGYCALSPNDPFEGTQQLLAVVAAIVLLVSIGFLDDWKGLPAKVKLVFQVGVAWILVLAGFVFPLPPWFGTLQSPVETAFTLLWFITVINAVNFIDGSDGLATTISTTAMLFFVLIARILPAGIARDVGAYTRTLEVLGLTGAGTALPFLLYNMSPARCFLGDAGSTFFGLILGLLGVLTAQFNAADALGEVGEFSYSFLLVPWLILIVPLGDCIRVTASRIVRGRSPFRPDNRHLHHVLHKAGLSANQMLYLVTLGSAISTLMAAILIRSHHSPFLLMGAFVLLVHGLLWFLKSSYRARRFVTLKLNRRLLDFMDVAEGYEDPASFKERFEQELARAKRHGGALSVVVVGLLNDPAASSAPNPFENARFLENVLKAMRREDIKCRIAADRLAFLLIETDKDRGEQVRLRIMARFDSVRRGESSHLVISSGIAGFPSDGLSVASLLQVAEEGAFGKSVRLALVGSSGIGAHGGMDAGAGGIPGPGDSL